MAVLTFHSEVVIIPRSTNIPVAVEVTSFDIDSSCNLLMDTARVTLANSNEQLAKRFQSGDLITIRSGYEPALELEFIGFITKVSPNYPLVLHCADKMWLLDERQYQFPRENSSQPETERGKRSVISLKALIQDILKIEKEDGTIASDDEIIFDEEYPWDNILLRDYRMKTMSRKEALAKLKKDFALTFYYTLTGKLYAGFAYGEYIKPSFKLKRSNRQTISSFEGVSKENILPLGEFEIDLEIAALPDTNLSEVNLQTNNTALYVISQNKYSKDNQYRSVIVGKTSELDKLERMYLYQVVGKTKDEIDHVLVDLGAEKLSHIRYIGLEGTVKLFGWPGIRHSKIMHLQFAAKKELEGRYFIQRVRTSASISGFRREVELGRRADVPKIVDLTQNLSYYTELLNQLITHN